MRASACLAIVLRENRTSPGGRHPRGPRGADVQNSNVKIVEAITAEQRRLVYRFRYRIYVEEMKRFQQYADHEQKHVFEPLDRSGHVLAASNGSPELLVGTVRFNVGVDENFGIYTELYRLGHFAHFFPKNISITTKLMVAPSYRRSGLALDLAAFCYTRGLELGSCFDFIDCNPPLVPFFEHLGYRRTFRPVRHPEYGDVVPLVLVMHDVAHLRKVGSPFAEIGARFQDRLHSAEFFHDCSFGFQPSSVAFLTSQL